jgi:predicted AAA+ superfamily ATPase
MLAHQQGGLLNLAQLAGNLGISGHSVARYVDLLVDLLLVRRLPPLHANVGKRLVKSPKIYVRDSGLVHALLNINTDEDLLGHPVIGASWEGFVIEMLLGVAPRRTQASFYRTSSGAEVDLVLDMGARHGRWVCEIKHSQNATLSRGFYSALEDLTPTKAFVVHAGEDRFPKRNGVEAIGLAEMVQILAQLEA